MKIARVIPKADEPPAENIVESLAEVVATPELEAQARKALQACQANLSWIEQFQMESVTKYARTGLGRVEERETIAADGGKIQVRSIRDFIDQAEGTPMKVLGSFALDDGERIPARDMSGCSKDDYGRGHDARSSRTPLVFVRTIWSSIGRLLLRQPR